MGKWLHKLAEALRAKEQHLEDHSTHPAFVQAGNGPFKQEYSKLVSETKAFTKKVESAAKTGKDYDEHFEKKIEDEHRQLLVRIDAWSKHFED